MNGKRRLLCCLTAMLMISVACGRKNPPKNMKTLVWYYVNDRGSDDGSVFGAANKIIGEKLGVQVDFNPIHSEEYTKKIQLKASAAERFDIVFTSDWLFDYRSNIEYGAFAPIENLIEKYAPQTNKSIINKVWDAVTVGGHIYAVPNYQVAFRQKAIVFKKELVDKYSLKAEIDQAETMADFTPILQKIRANEPDIIPTTVTPYIWSGNFGDESLFFEDPLRNVPVGIDMDGNVLNLTENPYLQINLDNAALSRKWNSSGFYMSDIDIRTNFTAEKNAGKVFMFDDVYKPGIEIDMQSRYGYPVYVKAIGIPVLTNDSACAALTAVSRTSADKVTAVKLIELLNTDKELYNLLVYGIKDRDYKKLSYNTVEILSDRRYSAYAWAMGSQFNAFFIKGQNSNIWELTKKLNAEARKSPLLGKSIDTEPIKESITRIRELYSKLEISNASREDGYEQILGDYYGRIENDVKIIYDEIVKQNAVKQGGKQ